MAELYDITAQAPVNVFGPNGTSSPAMEITFTTKPSGVTGNVRIPIAQYTADEVNRVISAQARTMEEVHNL